MKIDTTDLALLAYELGDRKFYRLTDDFPAALDFIEHAAVTFTEVAEHWSDADELHGHSVSTDGVWSDHTWDDSISFYADEVLAFTIEHHAFPTTDQLKELARKAINRA